MPNYKPLHTRVVDPEGVNTSLAPRPMPITTDETRAETVKETGGDPLVDYDGKSNPYIDYQSIDILHSLQHMRGEGYDEMCFFVMGQVKELLFRGLHFELVNAREQVRQDNLDNALEILSRAKAYIDYIAGSWDVLSTISTEGFNQFRDHLGTASGQLSFMYRHVEFVLGNKSRKLAAAHKNLPHIWPEMEKSLNSPSLYDEIIALLHRNGLAIDGAALERDWGEDYQSNESVKTAWQEIYQSPATDNHLYRLGETLVALDEHFSIYRWRHFVSVHKIIGGKPGTGGSAGLGWLEHVTKHRFFPELWEIRDTL